MKNSNKSIQIQFSEQTNSASFFETETEIPQANAHDLVVEVKAISLNPVDTKVASGVSQSNPGPKTLGWDASGVVVKAGTSVTNFKAGDEVYYAGDITRTGANSKFHAIDSRLVSHKPQNLNFEQAAAIPLTAITAWEGLFEGLKINPEKTEGKTLLVIGGAGGVGSMVTQLAKKLTQLTVVTTASREDSISWSKKMGADIVIGRKNGLKAELENVGIKAVDYVFCTNDTENYFPMFEEIVNPFGKIVSIVEVSKPLDMGKLFKKSIGFSWEFMFTRSMFQADMDSQGKLLNSVKELVENGTIESTMTENFGVLTAENLTKAHQKLKSGTMIGKLVLTGIK